MSKMGRLFYDLFCDKIEEPKMNAKNNTVTVKVWNTNGEAILPRYAKYGDSCMDVFANYLEFDIEHKKVIVHTGLFFAVPHGYEMEARPRSSLTKYRWIIANSPGTIDSGYRGEFLVIFTPLDNDVDIVNSFPYNKGDRICQILVRERPEIFWECCNSLEELGNTERGKSGFGSTGK